MWYEDILEQRRKEKKLRRARRLAEGKHQRPVIKTGLLQLLLLISILDEVEKKL